MSMENILEDISQVEFHIGKCDFFPTVWGYFGICWRKWSRKNYDDWLYSEYNHERQRNSKAIWTGNAGRRYELA